MHSPSEFCFEVAVETTATKRENNLWMLQISEVNALRKKILHAESAGLLSRKGAGEQSGLNVDGRQLLRILFRRFRKHWMTEH